MQNIARQVRMMGHWRHYIQEITVHTWAQLCISGIAIVVDANEKSSQQKYV